MAEFRTKKNISVSSVSPAEQVTSDAATVKGELVSTTFDSVDVFLEVQEDSQTEWRASDIRTVESPQEFSRRFGELSGANKLSETVVGGIPNFDDSIADIEFNSDGTLLYILFEDQSRSAQYSLANPYDIATSSIVPDEVIEFSNLSNGFAEGFTFEENGNLLFTLSGNRVSKFNVSTPYDIGTASFEDRSVRNTFGQNRDLFFVDPKTVLIISAGSEIYDINLADPYDISEMSIRKSVDINNDNPGELLINSDGTKALITDLSNGDVKEYSFSTPYDIESLSFVGDVLTDLTDPNGAFINGTQLFISSKLGVKRYSSTNAFDFSDLSFDNVNVDFTGSRQINGGFAFGKQGDSIFFLEESGDNLVEIPLDSSYDLSTQKRPSKRLSLDQFGFGGISFECDVEFSRNGKKLFVSDSSQELFEIELESSFDIKSNPKRNNSINLSNTSEGFTIGDEGRRLYNTQNQVVEEFLLKKPYSFDNINKINTFDLPDTTRSVTFSPDGTRMFALLVGGEIKEAKLESPWKTKTATIASTSKKFNRDNIGDARSISFVNNQLFLKTSDEIIAKFDISPLSGDTLHNARAVSRTTLKKQTDFVDDEVLRRTGNEFSFLTDKDASVTTGSEAGVGPFSATLTGEIVNTGSSVDQKYNKRLIRYKQAAEEQTRATSVKASSQGTFSESIEGYRIDSIKKTASSKLEFGFQIPNPDDVNAGGNGEKFYVSSVNGSEYEIYQYQMEKNYDISSINRNQLTFSIKDQSTSAESVAFDNTGSRMYIIGNNKNTVFQYNLSEPFDLGTASYSGNSFDVSNEETNSHSVSFGDGGSKMYVIGSSEDSVFEYSLSTPFQISTASYSGNSLNVNTQEFRPRSVEFGDGGSKMYVSGTGDRGINEYDLDTKFDLSTASYVRRLGNFNGEGLSISENGKRIYVSDNDRIKVYDLETPFSLENVSKSFTRNIPRISNVNGLSVYEDFFFALSTNENKVKKYRVDKKDRFFNVKAGKQPEFKIADNDYEFNEKIRFGKNGFRLYVIEESSNYESPGVRQYNLSEQYDVSSAVFSGRSDLSDYLRNETVDSFRFNNDGSVLYVGTDNLLRYNLSSPYEINTASQDNSTGSKFDQTEYQFNEDGTEIIYTFGNNIIKDKLTNAYDPFSVDEEEIQKIDFYNAGKVEFVNGGTKLLSLFGNVAEIYPVGLKESTTYEFKAEAFTESNSDEGSFKSFSTQNLFYLRTLDVQNLGTQSVDLRGEIKSEGINSSSDVRFEYREKGETTWIQTPIQTVNSTGTVTETISGLSKDTVFEYRFRGQTGLKTKTAPIRTFRTKINISVRTDLAKKVKGNVEQFSDGISATLRGEVEKADTLSSGEAFFQYREIGTTVWTETSRVPVVGKGVFDQEVSGLDNAGKEYEYRFVLEDSNGDQTVGKIVPLTDGLFESFENGLSKWDVKDLNFEVKKDESVERLKINASDILTLNGISSAGIDGVPNQNRVAEWDVPIENPEVVSWNWLQEDFGNQGFYLINEDGNLEVAVGSIKDQIYVWDGEGNRRAIAINKSSNRWYKGILKPNFANGTYELEVYRTRNQYAESPVVSVNRDMKFGRELDRIAIGGSPGQITTTSVRFDRIRIRNEKNAFVETGRQNLRTTKYADLRSVVNSRKNLENGTINYQIGKVGSSTGENTAKRNLKLEKDTILYDGLDEGSTFRYRAVVETDKSVNYGDFVTFTVETPSDTDTAHWTFNDEDIENGDLVDVTGNGYDAKINSISQTGRDGKLGDAFRFNRFSDDNLGIRNLNYNSEQAISNLTISTWVRLEDEGTIISFDDNSYFALKHDRFENFFGSAFFNTDRNDWSQIIVSYDIAADYKEKIYINGNLENVRKDPLKGNDGFIGDTFKRFGAIGTEYSQNNFNNNGAGSDYFDGDIADLRLFDSENFSEEQVQILYSKENVGLDVNPPDFTSYSGGEFIAEFDELIVPDVSGELKFRYKNLDTLNVQETAPITVEGGGPYEKEVSQLSESTEYELTAVLNHAGQTITSRTIKFETPTKIPYDLNLQSGSSENVVSWSVTFPDDVTGANVYRGVVGEAGLSQIGSGITQNEFTDTSFDQNEDQRYVVTLVNENGEGPFEAQVPSENNNDFDVSTTSFTQAGLESMRLEGEVDPNVDDNLFVEVFFQYREQGKSNFQSTKREIVETRNGFDESYKEIIKELKTNQVYEYRIVGNASGSTERGNIQTFQLNDKNSSIRTVSALRLSSSKGEFTGLVDETYLYKSPVKVSFQYQEIDPTISNNELEFPNETPQTEISRDGQNYTQEVGGISTSPALNDPDGETVWVARAKYEAPNGKTAFGSKLRVKRQIILDFENGFDDKWIINDGDIEITDGISFSGNQSVTTSKGGSFGNGNLKFAERPIPQSTSKISFYWRETSSQNGAGFTVFNSNGEREVNFGTDNPQWNLFDGENNSFIESPNDSYRNWTFVEFDFNFDEGTYDYVISNEEDGGNTTATGTRDLRRGVDAVRIGLGDAVDKVANSSDSMWWDLITITQKELEGNIIEKTKFNSFAELGIDLGINGAIDNTFSTFGLDQGINIEKGEKNNTFANFRNKS